MNRSKDAYPYRDDEEMCVYDQTCENCCNECCPMEYPETAEEHLCVYGTLSGFDDRDAKRRYEEVVRRRKEDAALRDGEPIWCIYWKQGREWP